MPTILPASSFAQNQATVGLSYVFAGEDIRQEINEKIDVLADGLIMAVGDLEGSGSDTVRITRYGGIGYAEEMTSMTSENELIVPSGFTIGHDSVSLGRHGLAKEETFTSQVLGRAEAMGLERMIDHVPMSFLKTLRVDAALAGASFASGAGNTGLAWTYDDEIELCAMFNETAGFADVARTQGGVVAMRHPEQFTDLANSLRNEPGLQGRAEEVFSLLGLQGSEAFVFQGISNYRSHDVPTSGGDHVGCAYVRGALAWVVASTMRITPQNPESTIWIPEYGLIITRSSTGEGATVKFAANGFFGLSKLNPALFPQFKITSVND